MGRDEDREEGFFSKLMQFNLEGKLLWFGLIFVIWTISECNDAVKGCRGELRSEAR